MNKVFKAIVLAVCVVSFSLSALTMDVSASAVAVPSMPLVNGYLPSQLSGAYNNLSADNKGVADFIFGSYIAQYLGSRNWYWNMNGIRERAQVVAKIREMGSQMLEKTIIGQAVQQTTRPITKLISSVIQYAQGNTQAFADWIPSIGGGLNIPYSAETNQAIIDDVFGGTDNNIVNELQSTITLFVPSVSPYYPLNNISPPSMRDIASSYPTYSSALCGSYYVLAPIYNPSTGLKIDTLYLDTKNSVAYLYDVMGNVVSWNSTILPSSTYPFLVGYIDNTSFYSYESASSLYVTLSYVSFKWNNYSDLPLVATQLLTTGQPNGYGGYNRIATTAYGNSYSACRFNTITRVVYGPSYGEAVPIQNIDTWGWDDENAYGQAIDNPTVPMWLNLPRVIDDFTTMANTVEAQRVKAREVVERASVTNADTATSVGELTSAVSTDFVNNIVNVTPPEVGPVEVPDGLFSSAWKYVDYLWSMTKPLIEYTADLLLCLTIGEGGPSWIVYGAVVVGIAGGILFKFLQ